MNIFYAFIMGLVQGITEFLPVSSSGHLLLFTRITGNEPSLSFDLILHFATALAVIIFCRKEIVPLIKKPTSPLSLSLIVATATSAVLVFLLRDGVEKVFNDYHFLPLFFALTALLLLLSKLINRKKSNETPTLFQAVIIGFSQGLALFPGLSRSGTTFFAGNAVGLSPKSNASFCFLLSVPIIIGSTVVSLFEGSLSALSLPTILVGFTTAFVSGLLSLKLIKKVFSQKALTPFIVYTSLLSLFLFVNDTFLHAF